MYVETDSTPISDPTYILPYDATAIVLSREQICLIEAGLDGPYRARKPEYENWPEYTGRSIDDCVLGLRWATDYGGGARQAGSRESVWIMRIDF